MNWFQRKVCPAPTTTEVKVEIIVEKPTLIDPAKYEAACNEMHRAWAKVVEAEKRCRDLGITVKYEDKYAGKIPLNSIYHTYSVGHLSYYNLSTVAQMERKFEAPRN